MTESSQPERPLVTFALFAYNQEKYIREAVEGAFSQTYEPLEIILSDDCSSDRTFGIIQEMAAEYKGPHRVIARQSHGNRGLGRHVADVARMVSGTYVVVAAGDDISLPDRTSEMVAMMQADGNVLAASNYNGMTDDGHIYVRNLRNVYGGNYMWKIVNYNTTTFANGAAAVYETGFLRSALDAAADELATGHLFDEDTLIALYAIAIGAEVSQYQKAPLINYRLNPASLSNFAVTGRSFASEFSVVQRERFRSRTRLAVLNAALEIAGKYPRLDTCLNHDWIAANRHLALMEIDASERGFFRRLRGIFGSRSLHELRLRLVRLPGPQFHAAVRLVASSLRRE